MCRMQEILLIIISVKLCNDYFNTKIKRDIVI